MIDRKLSRCGGRLGLKPQGIAVVLALETYIPGPDAVAVVKLQTLATGLGTYPKTVAERLSRMDALSLIERRHRVRPKRGGNGTCAYTLHGIHRAFALIAANRRAGKADDDGLDALLHELRAANCKTRQAKDAGSANAIVETTVRALSERQSASRQHDRPRAVSTTVLK